MKTLAELRAAFEDRRTDLESCEALHERALATSDKTKKTLVAATTKAQATAEAFAEAQKLVVEREGDEKSLKRYVEADARRTATGLIVDAAQKSHAAAEAEVSRLVKSIDDAKAALDAAARALDAHPDTVSAETAEPSKAALDAILALMSACEKLDAAMRRSRIAVVGDDWSWSPLACNGAHTVANLFSLIESEHGRIPDGVQWAMARSWGEPQREPDERAANVKASQLAEVVGAVLAGPTASMANRELFRAELARVRQNFSYSDATAQGAREAEAFDRARIEKGHADAAAFRSDRAAKIANGTWKGPPMPKNFQGPPTFTTPGIAAAPPPPSNVRPFARPVMSPTRLVASHTSFDSVLDELLEPPTGLFPVSGDPLPPIRHIKE